MLINSFSLKFCSIIHLFDLSKEEALGVKPLEFESGSENVVFRGKSNGSEVKPLRDLEPEKPGLFTPRLDFMRYKVFQLLKSKYLLVSCVNELVLRCPLFNNWSIWHNNSDKIGL